jgi:hypothetical protein
MSLDHFETRDRTIHPVVTLKNGLRVANFSSPHPFTFDDGTVLDACPKSTVLGGILDSNEIEYKQQRNGVEFTDIDLSFKLSDSCKVMLDFVCRRPDVDIVLVPLPVLQCLQNLPLVPGPQHQFINRCLLKCRVVRVRDRISKVIYSNRFCI